MGYIPVRLNTLRPEHAVTFDLFIQVGERYLHYIRTTEFLESDRVKSLKKKKVRKLWIQEESEGKYLDYLDAGLNELTNKDISVEERANLACDAMATTAENAERAMDTEENYKRTESQFEKVVDFLTFQEGGLQQILKAAGASEDSSGHSANVASLAMGLAVELGITDQEDLTALGIASMTHDLGKTNMSFDPMTPRSELTKAQMAEYRKHPQIGADMLAGKPYITPRVLGLIANHEEIGHGMGFPEKKVLAKLQLPYQVLNLANDFDRFCIENKLGHTEAIDQFKEKRGEHFKEENIEALAKILKAES